MRMMIFCLFLILFDKMQEKRSLMNKCGQLNDILIVHTLHFGILALQITATECFKNLLLFLQVCNRRDQIVRDGEISMYYSH